MQRYLYIIKPSLIFYHRTKTLKNSKTSKNITICTYSIYQCIHSINLYAPLTPSLCLELLAFTRFSIPFRIFILKILNYINLVHMAVRSLRSTPQPHKIRCLEFPSRSTLSFAALCLCSLRASLPGLHPSVHYLQFQEN